MTTVKKWNDEAVATLQSVVGDASPVTAELVAAAAEALGVSVRSAASKLRQLGREVASMAKTEQPTFSPEQGQALADYVNNNAGLYTYAEIAASFPGEFSAKQIQGKLLAMELTDKVKPTEKAEVVRTYTADEEAIFIEMVNKGSFIEDIAAALKRELPSVRGKALSLNRAGLIASIPTQKQSHAKEVTDPVVALGDAVATMTVAEISKAIDKTERGVKTLLTRRGIKVADYDGAAKKAKALADKEATK